jgi:hypothetical protein
VDVRIGAAGADGGDQLPELAGGEPLPDSLDDLGRRDRASHGALGRTGRRQRGHGRWGRHGIRLTQAHHDVADGVSLAKVDVGLGDGFGQTLHE